MLYLKTNVKFANSWIIYDYLYLHNFKYLWYVRIVKRCVPQSSDVDPDRSAFIWIQRGIKWREKQNLTNNSEPKRVANLLRFRYRFENIFSSSCLKKIWWFYWPGSKFNQCGSTSLLQSCWCKILRIAVIWALYTTVADPYSFRPLGTGSWLHVFFLHIDRI